MGARRHDRADAARQVPADRRGDAARKHVGITSGFAAAAQRCPDRPGLVDELGTLTWREIDQRADAFAAALQAPARRAVRR